MPDIVPLHLPGQTFTCHAEAAVTGGRFVDISGPRVDGNYQVSHATAGAETIGVTARDKGAGDKVMVFGAGAIVPMTASGAITAGDEVEVGANGRPATLAAGAAVGKAMDDAADGAEVPVLIY